MTGADTAAVTLSFPLTVGIHIHIFQLPWWLMQLSSSKFIAQKFRATSDPKKCWFPLSKLFFSGAGNQQFQHPKAREEGEGSYSSSWAE